MSRFTEILIVSPLADGKTWVTRRDFGYEIGCEGSGNVINVPIGFQTDFASVPRLFWVVFPRWGRYGNAAVIHDYCYWQQALSRRKADAVFFEAMGVLQVAWYQKYPLYWAVRTFGWWPWWRNRQRRARGLDKVAATLPLKSVELPTWR